MANAPLKRPYLFLFTLLGASLLPACNAVTPAPVAAELVLDSKPSVPSLGLGTELPTWPQEKREDPRDWKVIDRKAQSEAFAKPGLNLSLRATTSKLNGDFRGKDAFASDDGVLFLPDVETSAGFGVDVGFRWQRYEILFAWQETSYDADVGGASKETTIRYADLNFREYFRIGTRLQPFLTAGLGYSQADVANGFRDGGGNLSTSELRNGINFNFGAGAAFFVNPDLSVFGQLLYRFGRYGALSGDEPAANADEVIDSDGWELSIGVSFNLLDPWN